MLDFFRHLFSGEKPEGNSEHVNVSDDKQIKIATCALFLEVANSDQNFSDDEHAKITELMKKLFSLTEDEAEKLLSVSEKYRSQSVSIYEFTDIINKYFSKEKKYEVVKNLWRLVYVDKSVDQYEDYYVRKISSNIKLSHEEFIAAKLEIKEELGL